MLSVAIGRVVAFRLRRHHLSARVPGSRWLEVPGEIAGLHAQVLSSAELSVWARARGYRREDLRRGLWEERTLARTWLMRGTLHVVPADELALYALGRGTQLYRRPLWLRYHELAEADLDRLLEAIAGALDGACLTRTELTDEVCRRAGERFRERLRSGWGEFLKPAACSGLLCQGPPRGSEVTFVRPDQWLAGWRLPDPREARMELVRRYLRAHGPADRADFTWWIGLEPPMARPAWEAVLPDLALIEVDGRPAWCLPEDLPFLTGPAARRAAPARLLPGFDPFVLGHRRRSHLVDAGHHERIYRKAGWVSPVVLAGDGLRASGLTSPPRAPCVSGWSPSGSSPRPSGRTSTGRPSRWADGSACPPRSR